MQLSAIIVFASAIMLGMPNTCWADERGPTSEASVRVPADIQLLFESYFRSVEAGDPEGILAHIDTDFVIKWPMGQPIVDRHLLRAALASLQKRVRQEIQWGIEEAHVTNDWAWVRSWERPTHYQKAGGEPRTLDGHRLTILRKVNGRWLIHRDYASLNALPQPASR